MKILHTVQLYHPAVGGSEEVVKQLSERLTRRGHQVTVATAYNQDRSQNSLNGVTIEQFKLNGSNAFGIQGEEQEITRYQNLILSKNQDKPFDIIMNYGILVWPTDLMLTQLSQISSKKILVPLGFWGQTEPSCQEYFQKLPSHLKQYNKIIYLSKVNEQNTLIQQNHLTNGTIIPNAANEDEFLKPSEDFRKKFGIKTEYMLVSVSNHYPLKGHNFVIEAFKKLNRRDVTLVMIGGKPANFGLSLFSSCSPVCIIQGMVTKNLKVLNGLTREDTVAAFKSADLFVFGSKFECSPLVIFEAMAAGIPFVSTDCGNVQEYSEFGSISGTTQQMADQINVLLRNPAHRKQIGQAAFNNWQKHFTWEKITDRYEELYQELLN